MTSEKKIKLKDRCKDIQKRIDRQKMCKTIDIFKRKTERQKATAERK